MHLSHDRLQLDPNTFESYPSDGHRPYVVFEIYGTAHGGHVAALISEITLRDSLPSGLRGRKRRKLIETLGAKVLEHTMKHLFPDARYIPAHEGAMLEFPLEIPVGEPVVPAHIEQRLLSETRAVTFNEQLQDPQSPMHRELGQRLRNATIGSEWQKYFPDGH